jgi:hypothetical protein
VQYGVIAVIVGLGSVIAAFVSSLLALLVGSVLAVWCGMLVGLGLV